jgi:hypothetical protein
VKQATPGCLCEWVTNRRPKMKGWKLKDYARVRIVVLADADWFSHNLQYTHLYFHASQVAPIVQLLSRDAAVHTLIETEFSQTRWRHCGHLCFASWRP